MIKGIPSAFAIGLAFAGLLAACASLHTALSSTEELRCGNANLFANVPFRGTSWNPLVEEKMTVGDAWAMSIWVSRKRDTLTPKECYDLANEFLSARWNKGYPRYAENN